VLHHDLNISNILFQGDSVSGYKFQLIDTNRMDFKQQLSLRKRIENMRRLSCGSAAYAYLLERYAEKMNQPENSFELRGLLARLIFDERQRTKQKVKQRIKQRLR
ncbi:MAG: LPS kinase Kdo/WaaP, partial [Alistipes sp.]|nr:LPS kinase Kdo/WaaP [Alistipes sp.]